MSARHIVCRAAEADFVRPQGWAADAEGYRRWTVVDEAGGAVHTGFGICELAPGGEEPPHVHSFEESVFVVEGSGVLATSEGTFRLDPGTYGLVPIGVPHSWRNDGDEPVRWAEMQGPVPRERFDRDTFVVPAVPAVPGSWPPVAVDVRDPRTRRFGHITPAQMDATKQSQDLLAVSASMRTALLVYSGITVKMMVDSDLGAQLTTMFMVQYAPDGLAGAHDHPFEETYYFLEGRAEGSFDGTTYELGPGDVAWAGVGCVHGFRNVGDGPLRWLETQSPQPPARHSYRFERDWDYLRGVLG
ncbi:MAG: cupin domain-containing protein [Acidimicrobiales bacterium]